MARLNDGVNNQDYYNELGLRRHAVSLFRNVGQDGFSKVGYNFGGPRSLSNIQYIESYRGTGMEPVWPGIAWEPVNNPVGTSRTCSVIFRTAA